MEPITTEAIIPTPVIIEKDVIGTIVTVNRLKHYAFIKRKDNDQYRDISARDVSIINQTGKPTFFMSDTCHFDIKKTSRGLEAVNISIEKRHIDSIARLPKIPHKKKNLQQQTQIPCEVFQSTISQLFREVLSSHTRQETRKK